MTLLPIDPSIAALHDDGQIELVQVSGCLPS